MAGMKLGGERGIEGARRGDTWGKGGGHLFTGGARAISGFFPFVRIDMHEHKSFEKANSGKTKIGLGGK